MSHIRDFGLKNGFFSNMKTARHWRTVLMLLYLSDFKRYIVKREAPKTKGVSISYTPFRTGWLISR